MEGADCQCNGERPVPCPVQVQAAHYDLGSVAELVDGEPVVFDLLKDELNELITREGVGREPGSPRTTASGQQKAAVVPKANKRTARDSIIKTGGFRRQSFEAGGSRASIDHSHIRPPQPAPFGHH